VPGGSPAMRLERRPGASGAFVTGCVVQP
jgi:hypothetical protein